MTNFSERRRAYLESAAARPYTPPAAGSMASLVPGEAFYPLPLLELGRAVPDSDALLQPSFSRIDDRRDCADFALAGLLRLIYRYGDAAPAGLVPPALRHRIEQSALDFCHWYDQKTPSDGRGIRGMCFHTENHQILFHGCELLTGQLFSDRVFPGTGHAGSWHVANGARLAQRWMDERARFGFSEWLSCYFEEDLLALLNLYDFAADPEIRRRAGMLCDLLLFELALHAHRGVMGTTHGRVYAEFLKGTRRDPLTGICWLIFGLGEMPAESSLALTALATSDYCCPAILEAIAHDRPAEMICRERHGLSVDEASGFGIDPARVEDQMFFWACQTARHPAARAAARRVAEIADDSWLLDFIDGVDAPRETSRALVESGGGTFDGDAVNTALSAVDLVTFRTPAYSLSCAQDFRPGRPGYQQHIWQATLDADAVVFTNHPGTDNESAEHTHRPNFWAGNRWLPRAAQHRNVVICVHHVPADDPLPFSHAYFPRAAFDEVVERGNWLFARKGDAYVALYSQHPARWAGPEEWRSDTPDNVWICEMGEAAIWGSFTAFVEAIAAAPIRAEGLAIEYASPSLGHTIRFGWTGPLLIGGQEVPLHDYLRFDNPYCHASLGDTVYTVTHGDERLVWDFSATSE